MPIPEVDRGRAEFPNVKGIVMEVTAKGMHKIETEHGVLNNLYAANCITPCREAFLSVENVLETTVSLRTAANSSAMGSGTFKCEYKAILLVRDAMCSSKFNGGSCSLCCKTSPYIQCIPQ